MFFLYVLLCIRIINQVTVVNKACLFSTDFARYKVLNTWGWLKLSVVRSGILFILLRERDLGRWANQRPSTQWVTRPKPESAFMNWTENQELCWVTSPCDVRVIEKIWCLDDLLRTLHLSLLKTSAIALLVPSNKLGTHSSLRQIMSKITW